jgi:hypothetical protein
MNKRRPLIIDFSAPTLYGGTRTFQRASGELIVSHLHPNSTRQSPPATPRWVKVSGIILVLFIILFGVLHLSGNSLGGPGNHSPSIEHGLHQP